MSITVGTKVVTEENNNSPEEMVVLFNEGMKVIRLATIGRITSTIVHEINNPMQSIQGGAALGLEELGDPEAAKLYFELIQRESSRVLKLTELLRSIYHPKKDTPDPVQLKLVLDEVFLLIKDDLNQKCIVLENHCKDTLVLIRIPRTQLLIALLNIFLNFNNTLMLAGHRDLALDVVEKDGKAELIFTSSLLVEIDPRKANQKSFVDLSLAEKIIKSNAGTINLVVDRASSELQIVLPAGKSGDLRP